MDRSYNYFFILLLFLTDNLLLKMTIQTRDQTNTPQNGQKMSLPKYPFVTTLHAPPLAATAASATTNQPLPLKN